MSTAAGVLEGIGALVLGADEIGSGIARRFEREGARVMLVESADVPRAIPDSVAALGRLDVLVCNLLPAARPLALEALDSATFFSGFDYVAATHAAMVATLPALRASGRGRILLVGHRYGESVSDGLGAYNPAAWSLVGLARTAAVEWGQHQIATNVLLPLAATAEFRAARDRRPAIIDRLVSQLPLRRVGDPVEDIGGAAVFLASDAACFVNGQVLCADGGQQVGGPVLNPARFA